MLKIIRGGAKKNSLSFLCLGLFLFVFSASAIAITKGFISSDESLKPGMVVSLSSDSSDSKNPNVERANEENSDRIVGVATTVDEGTITVASSGQNVFVESSGEISAYVSDLNGKVKRGDQLTVSPLSGIMANFAPGSKVVLGVALEDFPDQNYQTRQIESADGSKTVNIAQISVNLDMKNLVQNSQLDSSLERLGRSVAGKDVSEIRIIAALVIFLLVLLAEGSILYGAISSSITSVGRNPLASKSIRKQLLQVIVVAMAVLILGLLAIYVILLT